MKKILKKRWDKHYCKNNKKRYWHLIIDSLFAIIILTLVLVNTYLSTSNSGLVLGTQHDDQNNTVESNQNQNTDNNSTTTDNQIKEDEPITIVSTDIKLQSLARYYTPEGDQLGVGPLPPVAETITNYWIFISIDGFTHNLQDTIISAKLPTNVSLTGKSSVTMGENISFNENSREIKWVLGNLLTSDNLQPIGLAFEVQLTPSNGQVGSTANLLSNIRISALDSVTGKNIIRTNPILTTNLINDKLANSDGTIIAK